MKKSLVFICVLFCALLVLCACADSSVLVIGEQVGFDSAPSASSVGERIEITIDTSGLNKSYDAIPVEYPSYSSDLDTDPRVNYFWYEKTENGYEQIFEPPVYVGEYKVVIKTVEDGTTAFYGEATALFEITPAIITPLSGGLFHYNGASVFVVENVPAMGTDRIGYEIAFEHGNVGAPLQYIRIFGENAENYAMDPEFLPAISPRVLRVSDLAMGEVQKTYDATDLVALYLDESILPGILEGESTSVLVSGNVVNVGAAQVSGAVAMTSSNPNYKIVGSFSFGLEVTPATVKLPETVTYCGKSEVAISLSTGLGNDVLDVTLSFAGKDAGSVLAQNGVQLGGVYAQNYKMPENPSVTIIPCVLDLSALHGFVAVKPFDGTDKLTLSLTNAEFSQIPTDEVLLLEGSVAQTDLCVAKECIFLPFATNGNFTVINSLQLSLSIEKAVVKLSGVIEFAYNGMAERPLANDSAYVSGVSSVAPVGLVLVFESAEPGAALLGVKMIGENAKYYESDAAELEATIRQVELSLNAKHISFAANGENTRVICAAKSYLLTAVAQGDDVCVVFTFASAEAGAALVSVELVGEDAYKYVLNTEDLTAILV